MPITFQFEPERKLIRLRRSGVLTAEEDLRVMDQILGDPRYPGTTRLLCDTREEAAPPDRSHVEQLIKRILRVPDPLRPARSAIVVTNDLTWGFVRMVDVFVANDRFEIMPFRCCREAEEWVLEDDLKDGDGSP